MTDPADIVRAALEQLPDDPTDVSDDHLDVLLAAHRGLGVTALGIRAGRARIAALLADGAALSEVAADIDWLDALARRTAQASALLDPYTARACMALGLDLDALAERVAIHKEEGR